MHKQVACRDSKELKKALEKLCLQDNFHHNLHVLESKSGQLIVRQGPGVEEERSQDDFLPCPDCLGFLKRKDLWRHVKVCNFRSTGSHVDDDEGDDMKYQRFQTKSKLLILPSICPGKSSLFQDVVASTRSDDITLVFWNHSVIWNHDGRKGWHKEISRHFTKDVTPCSSTNIT